MKQTAVEWLEKIRHGQKGQPFDDYEWEIAFNHAKEIARSSHELESILDWCKEACSQEWRWQLVDSSGERQLGRYIFYFNDERDFCTFILKWS